MTNVHDSWTDQLSGYLDGEMQGARLRSLEEHLAGCETCRDVLAELRQVKEAARRLGESQPSRDLWPGIAAAMVRSPGEADVIALPVDRRHAQGSPRRPGVFLTVRQLAAAAVVLVSLSAAATWWAGVGIATRPDAGVALDAPPVSAARAVADVPGPPAYMSEELSALEGTLADLRDRLDPTTVRILERNLDVIQRAIDESVQALAVDPGNAFLLEHLQRAYEDKVDFLREATSLPDWEG
jgi:anti-sigma factor RsiW